MTNKFGNIDGADDRFRNMDGSDARFPHVSNIAELHKHNNNMWNEAIEVAAKAIEACPVYMRITDRITAATAVRALKKNIA